MILGTAWASGCWGWASGLQIRGAVWLGILLAPLPAPYACHPACTTTSILPAFQPVPLACTHSWACLPACTPCSHPACTPACCPVWAVRWQRCLGCRCFRGGGSPCYLPAQRSRNAATVTGTNTGRVRLGGWAPAGTCGHPPKWHQCRQGGEGQGAIIRMSRNGGSPPCTPVLGSRGHVWLPRVVLPAGVRCTCVYTCAVQTAPWVPPWGTAMGHSGLGVPIRAPCRVGPHLGWGLDRKR